MLCFSSYQCVVLDCACRREALKQTIVGDNAENNKKKSRCVCGKKDKKKKKAKLYNAGANEGMSILSTYQCQYIT